MAKTIGLRKIEIKKAKVSASDGRGRTGSINTVSKASKLKEKNKDEDEALPFSEEVSKEDRLEQVQE